MKKIRRDQLFCFVVTFLILLPTFPAAHDKTHENHGFKMLSAYREMLGILFWFV